MTEEIILKINDKNLPLNDLMKSMLVNLIMAYLKSAKGVPEEIKKVSIEINL